ncbi:MAG: hypothetical protein SWO11_23960, partial [Thermodesulfobacteriota bacterium]|nr:hypothetical protein [Thermodesulfobacteriota bacterium]
GRVMTKLATTSETAMALCFLVMNLEKWLKTILLRLFFKELKSKFLLKQELFRASCGYETASNRL